MAVYKVPQDVEAEDKLVGPFSFRQFVYLLIAGGAGGLTVLFFNAPIPVPFFSIVTIPVLLGFLILALPLRKDQPMEIYLAAVLRFMLKPKRRLWVNDGGMVGVVIDATAVVQRQFSKDLTQEQALDRLSYLSRIVDTRGWAAKGVDIPNDSAVSVAVANEAYAAEDILDENTGLAKSFDDLIAKQREESRKEMMERMQRPAPSRPTPQSTPQPTIATPITDDRTTPQLHFDPYPAMHQHVLDPSGQGLATPAVAPPAKNVQKTTDKKLTPPVSPGIMRLANNNDLSIQAIANEARRISEQEDEEEVVIKLH